jgi:hypothetical protein
MELQGSIKTIGETNTYGNNGFRKRELVLTTDETYPQDILIEFVQDKCDILNNYKKGQNVKIGINIRGREWVNPQGEVKYFNSIQGWCINNAGQNNPLPSEPFEPANDLNEEEHQDLPF